MAGSCARSLIIFIFQKEKSSKKRKQSKNTGSVEETVLPAEEYIDNIANEEQKNNPFNRKLLRIYLNQYINSTIATYDMRHIPQEKINNEITNYQTTYNADGSWENISLKKYTSNHYPKIYWFEMKNQNITNIRIIFANNEKAQFCIDYNFASAYYEDLIPLIRSAAASVKPNLEPQITILWKKPIGTYITGS